MRQWMCEPGATVRAPWVGSEPVRYVRTGIAGPDLAVEVECHGIGSGWGEPGSGVVVRFLDFAIHPGVVDHFCETLGEVEGLLPSGVEPDEQGRVPVPLLEPEAFRADEVVWRVTPTLAVRLRQTREVHFEVSGVETVALDGSETWRLLRALASTRVADRVLEAAAREAIATMGGAPERDADGSRLVQVRAGQTSRVALAFDMDWNQLDWRHEPSQAEGVVLCFTDWRLRSELIGDLREWMVQAPGVLEGIEVADGHVEVPPLEPDEIAVAVFEWRVCAGLTMRQSSDGEIEFESPEDEEVTLDGPDSWRLVRALAWAGLWVEWLDGAARREIAQLAVRRREAAARVAAGPTP